MQPETWLDQLAAERRTKLERRAAERAYRVLRRRRGVEARNRAKLERLNALPDDEWPLDEDL